MDDLNDELTCCICLELYTDPVMLPCSHNLCHSCAIGLLPNTPTIAYLICPECRAQAKLSMLMENRALANVVAKFKANKTKNIAAGNGQIQQQPCPIHFSCFRTHFCMICKSYVCQLSISDAIHHSHHVIPLADFVKETKVWICFGSF